MSKRVGSTIQMWWVRHEPDVTLCYTYSTTLTGSCVLLPVFGMQYISGIDRGDVIARGGQDFVGTGLRVQTIRNAARPNLRERGSGCAATSADVQDNRNVRSATFRPARRENRGAERVGWRWHRNAMPYVRKRCTPTSQERACREWRASTSHRAAGPGWEASTGACPLLPPCDHAMTRRML